MQQEQENSRLRSAENAESVMLSNQAQSAPVQPASETLEPSKSKGALWIAVGAFVLLVVLILTNMK